MGLIASLQHNGTRGLRGCMTMQSTTWPWPAGVSGYRQSNELDSKRTWRIRESSLRFVSVLLVTVWDAISGFECDSCSSRLLPSQHCKSERITIYPNWSEAERRVLRQVATGAVHLSATSPHMIKTASINPVDPVNPVCRCLNLRKQQEETCCCNQPVSVRARSRQSWFWRTNWLILLRPLLL